LEPMFRSGIAQRLGEHRTALFWQDRQHMYSVDTHFTCFEDVETVCMWVEQLPDDEVSRLAGQPLRWLGDHYGCKVSSRHVSQARMLAMRIPTFRLALLSSSRAFLRNLDSKEAAVAACNFAMQLVRAQVLPGTFRADLLIHVAAIWPNCMRIILPHASVQRRGRARARTRARVQAQARAPGPARTQTAPAVLPLRAPPAFRRAEGLFRTQSEPGRMSCAHTSLRPQAPHVRISAVVENQHIILPDVWTWGVLPSLIPPDFCQRCAGHSKDCLPRFHHLHDTPYCQAVLSVSICTNPTHSSRGMRPAQGKGPSNIIE